MKTKKPKLLKLVDIVPGKLYLRTMSPATAGFDLISFECSEERGALRGFVKVFCRGKEIFPTHPPTGANFTVNTSSTTGLNYPMQAHVDQTGLIVVSSGFVWANPNLINIRADLNQKIARREQEIAELRETYELLKRV